MSKSKSLGSSPIGYSSSGTESYHFIPDLGVSSIQKQEEAAEEESTVNSQQKGAIGKSQSETENVSVSSIKKTEKKIASYYLKANLIDKLKEVADSKGIYYSSLVSDAINYWITNHDYD